MRKSVAAVVGAFAAGAVFALAGPASAAATGVIHVPSDFDHSLSDTRANGHYEVVPTGLHVYTDGNGDLGADGKNSDKVAEYVDTDTPLASIGSPNLNYTTNFGSIPPGYQLVVDLNHDGTTDGILVGEPTAYGDQWWLAGSTDPVIRAQSPQHGGGGSPYFGTLSEWNADFPNAVVTAFGFSLGSGVYGDYVINSINFAGATYTFAKDVVLTSKDQCKNGGWATSSMPVYKNQGQCVSSFASGK